MGDRRSFEADDQAGSGLRRDLLVWYRPRRDAYPWRGTRPDAYLVLVSEVMLQQTQARRVAAAFEVFVRRFPTLDDLARAPRSEVLRAWGGLGYNRRAVRLSEAARAIVRDHGGRVPSDPAALASLPGVGPYTASAVASIAYGAPVPAVDTNVRRVVARVLLGGEPGEAPAATLQATAESWLDRGDPGAWNQAVMDLGREHCRPRPRCGSCPLAGPCRFRARAAAPQAGPPVCRQAPFEGSSRQVRGAVVRALRDRPASVARLTILTGAGRERTLSALRALAAEGLVSAGPAALSGAPGGRVRLAD